MDRSWAETGMVRLTGVLDDRGWDALSAEAHAVVGGARLFERDATASHRDGSFASPAHCRLAGGGPALGALAYDKTVLAALRQATGLARLVPVGCAVVVYHGGDFQGLHTDTVKSTLTVALEFTDVLPPMGWAPTLRAAHPDELAKVVAEYGLFPAGDSFSALQHPRWDGSGAVQGFAGYDIPHWRAPFDGELAILATWSYMDL
ncbi:MAG: hypothetical protein L0Y54_15105 [Sporichthyaceae bacterium]|nr:hypothetical protein [Sporichthyaceae bacterium]